MAQSSAQSAPLTDLPSRPPSVLEAPYQLEAGDEIEIRFVYNPEFNERVQIRPDGRISMPTIGEITAAGMTIADLSARLTNSYSSLKRPDLTIQVRTFANRKVFVGGEVSRPGALPIVGPKTVAEAIVESGGMKETARRGTVVLIRRSPAGTPTRYEIPAFKNGNGPDTTTVALQPYDVVLVTESGIAKADRAVDQYIRRLIPGLLTGGFSYLAGPGGFIPH